MTRSRLLRAAIPAVILALAFVIVAGLLSARGDPVVRRATIVMRGMPADTPRLRVALVSDIHVGNLATPVARLDRIVAQINAQHPDAVLIAGDLVNGVNNTSSDFHPDMVGALSRLRAPRGLYAVLGNHDDDTSPALVDAALQRAGITVLHDQVVRLGPIALIGEDMYEYQPKALAPLIAQARRLGGLRVLITHQPPFKGLISHDIPVIFAGHSHCGQIVFPGFDNSYDYFHGTWRYPPQTRCGLVRYDRHLEIITAGTGAATIAPLRINAPPDFWMITFVGQPA